MEKTIKQKLVQDFGKSAQDTGCTAVQIALWTEKIKLLEEHFKKFPKDVGSKRGLLKAVASRRSALSYLEKNNQEEYQSVIKRLNLRK
ncbi:MAG: 30S ribosomal protein S15 [Candidatus Babeliales bacterium]